MGITLAGRAFVAGSFLAAVERILHQASAAIHIFNPTVPEQLQLIAMAVTVKAPELRYANALELLKDFRLVQAGVTQTELALAALMRYRSPKKWLLVSLLYRDDCGQCLRQLPCEEC